MKLRSIANTLLVAGSLVACNVRSTVGQDRGIALGDGNTTRGIAVVNTDYQSSLISLLSLSGEVASPQLLSSGSARTGLSAALSGDVVLPTSIVPGKELVLIDRYPAAVLTWVNLQTAKVRAQLSVATGFVSNPHDYVPYADNKAFVTRYEPNLTTGRVAFDAGNDVLTIDPSVPSITGSIDLTPAFAGEAARYYPRADRAVLAGGKLRVLCVGYNRDFTDSAESRIVTIDPESDTITQVLVFPGMHACGSLSLSPDRSQLAVACNGAFGEDPSSHFPSSGLMLLDVDTDLSISRQLSSPELGVDEQIAGVDWVDDRSLLFTTFGRYNSDQTAVLANDALRWLDTSASEVAPQLLLESQRTPFTIGDLRCDETGGACFVSDAETGGGVVHRFSIADDGSVTLTHDIKVDTKVGLPPRGLGKF